MINYHINKTDCILTELLNMLVTIEGTLKSSKGILLLIKRASTFNRKFTWKKKKPTKKQKKESRLKKKDIPKKAAAGRKKCFHCDPEGY